MSALPDPCPLPSGEKKQRKLDEKQKLLYAPMVRRRFRGCTLPESVRDGT